MDWMMITCQAVNESIKVACVFSVERSRGKMFQLKVADFEEVLAKHLVILKPKQKEAIKSF